MQVRVKNIMLCHIYVYIYICCMKVQCPFYRK